jgi:hypothetical protein
MGWTGHVACMEGIRNSYKISIGKSEGKRLLGRPRCRLGNNSRIGPREIGCEGVDWINLAQDRDQWWALVSKVISMQVL